MGKKKPWSEGRDSMRRQIDREKRKIKKEIDRKEKERKKRKE